MATGIPRGIDRFTSLLLAGAVLFLWISGIVMLYGSWVPWLFDLHRIAGFFLIVLLVFKSIAIFSPVQSLERNILGRKVDLLLSVVFTGWIMLISSLGIAWMWRLGPYSSLHQTLITWHWILGVLILPVFALYARRSWPRQPEQEILGRRNFLKLLGLVGGSLLLTRLGARLAEAQATTDRPRRFTGSRGFGSFTGNDFPITGESTVMLDLEEWRLAIDGAVAMPMRLDYPDILALPTQTMTEAIDCHNGWYSLQDWQGVSLANLLEQAGMEDNATGVRLVSATGLTNTYPIQEASQILLATHVSGQVLDAAHGFPLRAVVPGRRGWFWLKWLERIEVLDGVLDVMGGILCTPLQVFRELDYPRASSDIP